MEYSIFVTNVVKHVVVADFEPILVRMFITKHLGYKIDSDPKHIPIRTFGYEATKIERNMIMEKKYFANLEYHEVNGVFIPDIELPEEKEIGRFGWQHEASLKQHHRFRHSHLIGSGEILDYLASVDAEANEMYESLIADFAKAEDVDENLKATDQMRWIQRMQSIANRVREIVEKEVIFR